MYLSRLILNLRSRAVQRDLADCHELHRTVMSAFPAAPSETDARTAFGVLHRLDTDDKKTCLLVQSSLEPDWSRLRPEYLMPSGLEVRNPACKPVDDSYQSLTGGMTLRFRLRANPTRKIDTKTGTNGQKNNGQRVPLRGDEAQIEWLRRRGDQAGFVLLAVRTSASVPNVAATPQGNLKAQRQGDTITVSSVVFEGMLKITDIQKFRMAIVEGIGPAKAFGCGLLSVAPVRRSA